MNLKHHAYLSDTKEDFFLMYSNMLGVFYDMQQSEIKEFSFLLQYSDEIKFSIDKPIRLEIAKTTGLNERTIYNTVKVLEKKEFILKHSTGAYQVNPKYAFKKSNEEGNNKFKLIIELNDKDC